MDEETTGVIEYFSFSSSGFVKVSVSPVSKILFVLGPEVSQG
jgi:hypothetical protein